MFREFFLSHMTAGKLEIDGVFCSTDLLAWRIQNILAKLDLRVPEDVQLIGFDGIRRFGGQALYCSTIIQPGLPARQLRPRGHHAGVDAQADMPICRYAAISRYI